MQNILTLGEINDALKFTTVTAAQLAEMGFAALANKPICEALPQEEARRLRTAKLYPAESIGQIRVTLAKRLAAPASCLHQIQEPTPVQTAQTVAPEFNLKTSAGGRGYVSWYFSNVMQRYDFGNYITKTLAADFACALASWLRDGKPRVESHAAPAAVAVPDGWKLVPCEPQDMQQAAGAQAIRFDTTLINKMWTANKVYREMVASAPECAALAATPAAPETEVDGGAGIAQKSGETQQPCGLCGGGEVVLPEPDLYEYQVQYATVIGDERKSWKTVHSQAAPQIGTVYTDYYKASTVRALLAEVSAPAAQAVTRDLQAVVSAAAEKLDAAKRCHPNAVETLIDEALEILDGDREPQAQAVPVKLIEAINAACGGNEWQGDSLVTDLIEPACRAIASLAPQAQADARDAEIQQAVLAERERICAAIRAEDDHCVTQGNYMLDSEDCINVVSGEWVRPVYEVAIAAAKGEQQ